MVLPLILEKLPQDELEDCHGRRRHAGQTGDRYCMGERGLMILAEDLNVEIAARRRLVSDLHPPMPHGHIVFVAPPFTPDAGIARQVELFGRVVITLLRLRRDPPQRGDASTDRRAAPPLSLLIA